MWLDFGKYVWWKSPIMGHNEKSKWDLSRAIYYSSKIFNLRIGFCIWTWPNFLNPFSTIPLHPHSSNEYFYIPTNRKHLSIKDILKLVMFFVILNLVKFHKLLINKKKLLYFCSDIFLQNANNKQKCLDTS